MENQSFTNSHTQPKQQQHHPIVTAQTQTFQSTQSTAMDIQQPSNSYQINPSNTQHQSEKFMIDQQKGPMTQTQVGNKKENSKKEESQSIKESQYTQNILWINFLKSVSQISFPDDFLIKLNEVINAKGQFSIQVIQLIKSKLSGQNIKKTLKAYRDCILNQLVQPILSPLNIDLNGLSLAQKIQPLYKSIGQRNQEEIVQFLQVQSDPQHQMFASTVKSLLNLYKSSKLNEPSIKPEFQNLDQELENQQQLLIKKINIQTQDFKKALKQKDTPLETSDIQQIMTLKFNHGSFSNEVDECIKNLKINGKNAKSIKNKVQKIFDQLFRNIQFSQSIKEKLQNYGILQDEYKDIKTYIRKGQEDKIKQKLFQEGQYNDKQNIEFLKELMSLRPEQIKSNSLTLISPSGSFKNIDSPQKKSSESNIKNQQIPFSKQTSVNQEVQKKQSNIYEQFVDPFQKQIEPFKMANESINIKEKNNKIQIVNQSLINDDEFFEQIRPFQSSPVRPENQYKKNKNFNKDYQYKQYKKPIHYVQKLENPVYMEKPYGQLPKIQDQFKPITETNKSKIQVIGKGKIENNNSSNFKQVVPSYQDNNFHPVNQSNIMKIDHNPYDFKNKQDYPSLISQDNQGFNEFRLPSQKEDNYLGIDQDIQLAAKYYDQQQGLHEFQREAGFENRNFQFIPKKHRIKFQNMKSNLYHQYLEIQKSAFDYRYVLILHQRNNYKFHIRRGKNENLNINDLILDRRQFNNFSALIIRLDFDPHIEYYAIDVPRQKGGFFGNIFRNDDFFSIVLNKKQLNQKLFHIQYLIDDKQKHFKEVNELKIFYLMTVLLEYSKHREYTKFWTTLMNFNRMIYNSNIRGWYENFIALERILPKNKNYSFDAESSRLFLYYIVNFIHNNKFQLRLQQPLLESVALIAQFEQCNSRPPFFKENYTFQYETKIILYCMLHRFSRDRPVHQPAFCQHLTTTLMLMKNFDEKRRLIYSLKNLCNYKLQELYPMIKQTIDLRNYTIIQFLSLRLRLINIQKVNNNIHQQRMFNSRLEDSKRLWMVQLIRQICIYIDHLPQNQVKYNNQQLKKLQKETLNDMRDILLGKNSSQHYFLFNHQLFYDFYSELIKLKENRKFDLYQYFQKTFSLPRKINAIEHVILKTQKFANMIAFMCSLDRDAQQTLEPIIKRMEYRNNLLNIVTCWFKDSFKEQNNEFFIKIFITIMNASKGQTFGPYQLMKTVEPFCQGEKIEKHIQIFVRSVFEKMKRLPQLGSELKFHLSDIKDIKKSIKVIYLNELSNRLQQSKPTLQKLQKTACQIFWEGSILVSDRQLIFRKLFQNRNDKQKEVIKQEIIQYYSSSKRDMKVLGYYNNFKQSLLELIQQIQNQQISYQIIENMKKPKFKMVTQKQVNEFIKLASTIDNNVKQMETLKRKSNSLIKVLKTYGQNFMDKIQNLEQWNKKVSSTQMKISVRNIRKFKQYLDYSDEMDSLMKIPLWDHQAIQQIEDLLKMRKRTIEQFQKLLQLFQKQSLSYKQFKKYFKIQILSTLLENAKDKDQKFKNKLSQYITYLDDKTLNNYVTSINSVNQICTSINKKYFFEPTYLEIVNSLQNPNQTITIQQAYKKIKAVDSKFKQINFDVLNQDQQILKTLVFKCKYQRVFDMIEQKKIDSKTVLNDLKQYINDVENSILKIQDIKELQNVVLFDQKLRAAKDFRQYLTELRKQVKTKNLKLSQNIYNIDSKVKQVQQMIDSSANRQTSFKYDLQQIFKDSVVRIRDNNGFAHIQIVIKQKNLLNENKNIKKQTNSVFTFKKLTQFKDKAILLVSDFQRSNQNQQIMQQTIGLFKDYLALYKILQEIQNSLEKAIIYGYNPLDLNQQRIIKDKDFESIAIMKIQIQRLSKDWIQGMKDMYEKSYLLTHFMGPKLNAFINDTLDFKFSPLIKQIVDLDQFAFGQRMDSLKFIGINTQKSSPIDKVKQICKIFEQIEAKTLKRFQKETMIEQNNIKSKIELITCHKVENYYFALVKGNSKPQMNQILYCQKQTSFQQIQVFIKRAIIKNHRKHYFIGVHYLPAQVQLKFIDFLNEYLKTQQKRIKFTKCKLCFIDHSSAEKIYLHLCKKELFDAKQITDTHLKTVQQSNYVLKNIGQTYLVESRIPGLGKTYWAQRKKPNSNIVYFSIAGHIHFSRLLQRLKSKIFKDNQPNTLIIQIGHVQNKNKLQIFLFQLIFFKGFNFKEFFFLPKNTTVVIEIQNVYDTEDKYQFYSILNIIKEQKEKYFFIDHFRLQALQPDFTNVEEAFTFSYLIKMYQKTILKDQQSYHKFQDLFKRNPNMRICNKEDARKLIQIYFVRQLAISKTEPTFWLYRSFIKLLFTSFKTFSQNGCFNVTIIESNNRANRNLGLLQVRLDFLNCCVSNCIQFLQATINTNEFNEVQKKQGQQPNKMPGEQDFRKKLSKFPFLIMPASDFHNYEFVYLNSQDVNISIKSLIISQSIYKYIRFNKHGYDRGTLQRKLDQAIVTNLFSENALQTLRQEHLQRQLYRILHQLSGNELFNISETKTIRQFKLQRQDIRNYSITLDNFFKMCLIIQRAISHIPIIVMGESGVGKTALISFLVQVVFGHRILIFNIHAGIDEQKLVEYYNQILKASQQIKNIPRQKVWVFFDEFNTTDELSYIKQMIIDRKFQGQPIPENVVLIGACNPYRKRKQTKLKRAGIKKKLTKNDKQSQDTLAFKVKPPSLSMIQFMWDYQQIQFKQNLNYISKILQNIGLIEHVKVVQTVAWIHEDFKDNYEISSVSLRDVTRFKELYIWFMDKMPDEDDLNQQSKHVNPNYKINRQQRAIALSIAFCYSLRIADRKQRKQLLIKMTQRLQFKNQIEQIVQNQQIDYVNRLKISTERIAINFSLRENVFTTLVCLMNKIPILIIGNPGNSKSLSIRMISSNLRGLNSDSKFCKQFPQLSIIYFQGSQACTSKGVEAVFEKAITSNVAFKQKKQKQPGLGDVQNCVLFDEIGLAQKSIHNPLKVLHSKLETNKKQICFIGISNWQLDAAKMSRFLVLSRSNPQKQELRDTAFKILQSYIYRQAYKHQKTFRQMSDWYYQFIQTWDKQYKDNEKESYKEGFFGLRDFYCYIKYVAEQLFNKSTDNLNDIIRRAILTNFDGQQGSVEKFLQISGLDRIDDNHINDPIKLVQDNLNKDSSRSLLLIVRGDALLPIIKDKIKIKKEVQRFQCIYGSTFSLDQQSEQYNLQMTSIIISHMSRGTILTFKNPNNSIQTSLYDVFNKSFTLSGPKKYCRVAVGANSNPKCVVHESFGSIVFMDEQIVKNTDLAFLNRFEKHYLTLSNVLSQYEKQIVFEIITWINNLIKFKQKTSFKKQEHYIINSSEQSIVTLVIRHKQSLEKYKQSGIKKIKKSLLKNATEHFYIALNADGKNFISQGLRSQINDLLKEIQNQKNGQFSSQMDESTSFQDIMQQEPVPKDKIIFTYDEAIYSSPSYMFYTQKTLKIRISEVKSEKQLRKSLKYAFLSDKIDNIHILIDFQKQFQHVNFIAFLLTGIKNEFKSDKTIYMIIKLSQNSLQNAVRDHINISYLLDFQQKFIDSLTLGKSFMEAISNKTVKQLYVERRMEDNFDNLYIQAQKRFRLMQNEKDIPKGIPAKDIKDFQFGQMMRMNQNQLFRKQALNFIYQNLNQTKIDVSIILSNRQDKNLCGSPQQSFQKYLQNAVIQTICLFFERVYRNSLLFSFDVQKLFDFYKKYYDVQILQIIYDQSKQIYNKFLAHSLDIFVKNKTLFSSLYLKQYNSNPLSIKSLCLLPMGLTQLEYISSNSEDSLFKTSSKILQLSVAPESEVIQQCQILMQKCMSILNEKSVFLKNVAAKKGVFDFEKYLNDNQQLQIFYFFDMISKIYSQSIESININTSVLPLQKLVWLFVQIFKKLQIKQKVIFLSLSKELWSNIFNIWSLWITHREQKYHRQMETHYLKNPIINQQKNQPHELPKLLMELCRSTLILQQKLLKLDINNINNYGIQKYLSFFRKTYFYIQKIRLTCMDLKVETSQTMKATKRFFDLLDGIFEKDDIQQQLTMFLTIQRPSFEAKVQQYLSGILKAKNLKQRDVESILSYLSLDIYSSWIKRLKQDKLNGQDVDDEIEHCIDSFIYYSDKYSSFANNSSFFLQNIFQQFIDNINTIEQKLEFIEHSRDDMTNTINQCLILRNNFAVSLGNFFMDNIAQCAAQQGIAGQRIGMNEQVKQSFIKKYLKNFQDCMKRTNYGSKVFEIFSIEFMKYYCLQYLQAVTHGQEHSVTWKVDELLNDLSNIADTMRLFLLKKMLYRQQKMTIIKEKFLDSKICKWLQHFRTLVSGKTFELLVPPPFEEQSKKMAELIIKLREQQYEKMDIFTLILKQSFASPITKYQFLTFMMNDIYTRSCPQDRVLKIAQIINKSEYYKDVSNTVEFSLLKCYLNHKVSSVIQYQIRQKQLPQHKIQQFVNNQLVFLNYLNIFVSCSKQQCPLIQMFFDLNGNVPEKYIQWIEKRFLINGRQNQSVSILKRFIQLGDNTPGYYKCSSKCDHFYTIGGSGGFGCQLPRVQGRCPWCNQIIGGLNHVLTRANEGARRVDLAALPNELQAIREKRKLDVLNHKLNGYSYSSNKQQMIKQVQSNKRLPQSVKYILQQMLFSVWSFLCSSGLLPQDVIKQIFRVNSNTFEYESYEIMTEFHKLQAKTINLNQQDQSSIVWHLGISKQIMKFMIGYKTQLSKDMKQKMGLVKCIGRDTFQDYLVNNVILRYSSGNDKLALINRSRCIKYGINLSGQQILRQTGGFQSLLQKYPRIRLVKLLHQDKTPCFDNLVKQYKEIINRDYKIFAHYIQKEDQIEKLIKYRTLYTFITKILKLFNMKISRKDAQTKTIVKLYEELYQNNIDSQSVSISNLNTFREQVVDFCQVWNSLRQCKFQLRYGCHSFGFMNQVTQKLDMTSFAINFFPDTKFKGDQKGQMILSLLQVTAQQYNQICRSINHLKMGEKKFRQIQIFNPKPINPTQIQPLTKTLLLNRQLVEGQFVTNFSNWSVQYGCGLPHYSIDKIEALIVEHIVGCHNLNEQIKEYDSINFIGQQLNFIIEIRTLQNQQEWDKIPKKQEMQKYIYTLKHDEPDSFLKQITSIKGYLELILHYCRLQKGVNFQSMRIQQFIKQNKIKVMSKTLITQQIFYSLEMKHILALYQFIELHTLANSAECLDDSYKKEKLSVNQEKNIKLFFDQLKKQYKQEEDAYYNLSVAIYRFVARSLLLVEKHEGLILFDFLYAGEDLWPHKFDMERLAGVKYFHDAFSITLTKMQALLDMIPLNLKKTKTEVLLIDKKKATQQMYAKNDPQKMKPIIPLKKKKNY